MYNTLLLNDDFPGEGDILLLTVLFTKVDCRSRLKLTQNLIFKISTIKPSVINHAINVHVEELIDVGDRYLVALLQLLNGCNPLEMMVALGRRLVVVIEQGLIKLRH